MNENHGRGGLATLAHHRDTPDEGPGQPDLLAYCALSGVLGTAAATFSSLAATGTARIAIWATVIGSVSLLAGLAYDSTPMRSLWSTWRPSRRHHADA